MSGDHEDSRDSSREPLSVVLAHAASLGPYRVLEPLGQGGMGVVYRARHQVSGRAVAVKTVRISAPRWIESIRREVDALTRIRHPGVVRIIDHGVDEGRPWYAMDLLEGESLRDFIARIWSPFRPASMPLAPVRTLTVTEPLSQSGEGEGATLRPPQRSAEDAPVAAGALPQVLALMRRLFATLAFLHGEGVVSCDLKPDNVLLGDTTPVLIDFGLSRRFPASTGREEMDGQRSLAGTLPYMSPEQARGELVDARSDLYSAGCILYELLTGAPPFTGAPFAIRAAHQSAAPIPPSRLIRDIPPALEALVLNLLEKQPNDRVGFADEVASVLAEIAGDQQRLHDFPPARPYLYRPRFVGRSEILTRLTQLRDQACVGRGSLALIGGESGVGKTRLALELTRSSAHAGLRIIASESSTFSADGASSPAAPLHVLRPLLRAVADRCQEGGAETTARLLGARRAVLAVYEPLLAAVPASESLGTAVALGPEQSRQRLLRYLAQTLAAFAEEQPLLWILDDLGWADDLSLAFLQSLTAEYLSGTPALLLGTYRTEQASEAIAALLSKPHVVPLTMDRLGAGEVSSMVADMLAAPRHQAGFTEYVTAAAEGNPFFVTEHVRNAVNERLFYRDHNHTWQLRSDPVASRNAYAGLPLPKSLRALVEQRLGALSDVAQESVRAAAVLGREFESALFAEVAGISPEAALAVTTELVRRQVLEPSGPEHLRFAHDKLREVAYGGNEALLQDAHARAAAALERRGADVDSQAAILGHHWACARQPAPAARYLKRAGDYARETLANADAIAHYRRSLELVSQLSGDQLTESWRAFSLELREALADVLALGANREQARAHYVEVLAGLDAQDAVGTARLHRKIGKTWEGGGDHTMALESYARARESLHGREAGDDSRAEWIQARFDALRVNYWLARESEMDSLMTELHPVVESRGTPEELAGFYQSQIFYALGRHRYVVSSEILDLSARVLQVCGAEGAPDRAWANFQRGFVLLLSEPSGSAEIYLREAWRLAESAGDLVNQARAALYLLVSARMQQDVGKVTEWLTPARAAATEAGLRQYVAAVRATEAWLLARDAEAGSEQLDAVLQLCAHAISEWRSYAGVYPFHWLALIPQLRVQLAKGMLDAAVDSCRSLLRLDQRRLPSVAESMLTSAIKSWQTGAVENAEAQMRSSLEILSSNALH